MSAHRQQALLDAPLEVVWGLVGTPSRHPEWWPRVIEARGERFDPLGRPLDEQGSMAGGTIAIPNQSDLARAREILEELRRRAGEASRAQQELDYIDRLLKQF